jgi:hypothetical protein
MPCIEWSAIDSLHDIAESCVEYDQCVDQRVINTKVSRLVRKLEARGKAMRIGNYCPDLRGEERRDRWGKYNIKPKRSWQTERTKIDQSIRKDKRIRLG